jgi:hypothetical protein
MFFFRGCFTPLNQVVKEVIWLWRTWATRTLGQAATTRGIVVEADIHFQKEEYTREHNKYLQTCIAAVQKRRTVTLRRPTPIKQHPYSRKQSNVLSVNWSSSLDISF